MKFKFKQLAPAAQDIATAAPEAAEADSDQQLLPLFRDKNMMYLLAQAAKIQAVQTHILEH